MMVHPGRTRRLLVRFIWMLGLTCAMAVVVALVGAAASLMMHGSVALGASIFGVTLAVVVTFVTSWIDGEWDK